MNQSNVDTATAGMTIAALIATAIISRSWFDILAILRASLGRSPNLWVRRCARGRGMIQRYQSITR
jgi:hypothetical protein